MLNCTNVFNLNIQPKILDFSFYLVTEWIGEPFGREGQEGFWLGGIALHQAHFVQAKKPSCPSRPKRLTNPFCDQIKTKI